MVKEILTKKPFTRPQPAAKNTPTINIVENTFVPHSDLTYDMVSQSDFLREYYPSGHRINSPFWYRDRLKYDEKNKRFVEEKVQRVSLPIQQIIVTQQLIHMLGNETNMELSAAHINKEQKNVLLEVKRGWYDKNLDTKIYEAVKAAKITGDAALLFFLNNGKLGIKPISFLSGDTLYPHYDIQGNMTTFARSFDDINDEGVAVVNWVEVYDETFYYLYKQTNTPIKKITTKIKELFGLDGYELVEKKRHGFNRVPVVYKRLDGPAWSAVQDLIEKLELAVSYLCQNNMAYAFPIMVLKGEDVEIQGDIYGEVKAITMGREDTAQYLERGNGTDSFRLQLETLLKQIFLGSYIVQPPEVHSGDLPGVAVKLIYAPSLDKAILDCKDFDQFIDDTLQLFLYGYGIEQQKLTTYLNAGIVAWLEPFVHQNTSELVNNLVQLANAHLISIDTAANASPYSQNDEYDKIIRDLKEEQARDILVDLNNSLNDNSTATDQQED